VSAGARPSVPPPELPAVWDRLEQAVADAAAALPYWRNRALQAEAEVVRLREALAEYGGSPDAALDLAEIVKDLRTENDALRKRTAQAHRRVNALLSWLSAVEERR
jgi:hypothetical protein